MTNKKPLKRIEEANTCLTYSVAFVFGLNPKRVPFFIGYPDWQKRLKRFFRRRGWIIEPFKYSSKLHREKGLYLIQGLSPRSKADPKKKPRGNQLEHIAVYEGRKLAYDPAGKKKAFKGRPRWIYIIAKVV